MTTPNFGDYFPFSRNERLGMIIFLIVIVAVTMANRVYDTYFKENHIIIIPDFDSTQYVSSDTLNELFEKLNLSVDLPLNGIDVNHADTTELKKLKGIGSVLSNRIVKFRKMKGGYSSLEDLKEVYGISEELYESIVPYLKISPAISSNQTPRKKKETTKDSLFQSEYNRDEPIYTLEKVDINTADSAAFEKLKGIGPVYARRIIKYREAIGGFESISQIKKVYGIDEELFLSLLPHLSISIKPKKVARKDSTLQVNEGTETKPKAQSVATYFDYDLNVVTADELQLIKGIGQYFSSKIIEQRKRLGGYAEMDQLMRINKLDSTVYDLLAENVSIKSAHVKFLLDTISFSNLLKMNILEYQEVKFVFNLKNQKGTIKNMDELRNLQGISRENLDLLEAYVLFQEVKK